MAEKRLFVVYYDVVNKTLRSSDGNAIGKNDKPYIVFREAPLMNLYLVIDDQNTPYAEFDGTEVFSASIDNNFDHDDTVMVKTDNTGINVSGDWKQDSVGDADPEAGEFSINLSANTTSFQTKIGSSQSLRDAFFELLAFDGGTGELLAAFQMDIVARNILDDDGTSPPAAVIQNFVWFEKDGEQCLRIMNDEGTTLVEFCPPGV